MMIPTSLVGLEMGETVVDVTPRMILAYAAGIGAEEEIYFDDLRPGGIVAPPPFIASFEWPLMISPAYQKGIGSTPDTMYDYLVHAFQDTRFHKLIRPGDRLRTAGRVVQVKETPPGALVVNLIETRDARSGHPVAETWFGALYRNVAVSNDAGTLPESLLRSEPGLAGDEIHRVSIPIPRTLSHIYTECANIWNPIHTERQAASKAHLPDIILHGTCVWALACLSIIRSQAHGDPNRLKRFAGRFSRMVIPGTSITVEHKADPETPGTVHFVVRNAAGETAISHGVAELE